MFSYFAKILKSSECQSVLKVYYLTKNRQKRAKSPNIRKLQIADYQYNIFFWFLLFLRYCTGSGYINRKGSCWLSLRYGNFLSFYRNIGGKFLKKQNRKLTGHTSECFTKSVGHSESGSGLTHKLRRMTTRIFQMFHQSQKKSSAIVELMKQLKLRFAHVSQRIQLKKFVVGGK